jgi:hypothetical protein
MLKCQIFNLYTFEWENQNRFFDTKEEMLDFIKNGDEVWKPDAIRVECAFKLEKIDIKL